MLTLVSSVAVGCGSSSNVPTVTDPPNNFAPDHPCYKKSNCNSFVVLPDDAAVPLPTGDAAVPDGGVISQCGPCNG